MAAFIGKNIYVGRILLNYNEINGQRGLPTQVHILLIVPKKEGRERERQKEKGRNTTSRPITQELQESIESSANIAATKCNGFSTNNIYTLGLRIIMQMLKSPIL